MHTYHTAVHTTHQISQDGDSRTVEVLSVISVTIQMGDALQISQRRMHFGHNITI